LTFLQMFVQTPLRNHVMVQQLLRPIQCAIKLWIQLLKHVME